MLELVHVGLIRRDVATADCVAEKQRGECSLTAGSYITPSLGTLFMTLVASNVTIPHWLFALKSIVALGPRTTFVSAAIPRL